MRDRTADPLLAKQVLSQLSYTPASSSFDLLLAEIPLVFPARFRSTRPLPKKLCFSGAPQFFKLQVVSDK